MGECGRKVRMKVVYVVGGIWERGNNESSIIIWGTLERTNLMGVFGRGARM